MTWNVHEDIKFYMTWNVIVTLPAQKTWIFHSRHVTGLGPYMNFHIKSGRGGGGEGGGEMEGLYWHFKFMPENLFSRISYVCQNFTWHIVVVIALAFFRIVMHSYIASFLKKFILCETDIFYLLRNKFFKKLFMYSERSLKLNVTSTPTFFFSYVYVSSYCSSKSSACKRDWIISPKWNKLRLWARPFFKALTEFYTL